MKTPHLVFLYSQYQERQLAESLNGDVSQITYLPLNQPLDKQLFPTDPFICIICDTSNEELGRARLSEIRRRHPSVPLFLIVKNPSADYLLAAFQLKVMDCFTHPVPLSDLREAVMHTIPASSTLPVLEKINNWLIQFPERLNRLFNRPPKPTLILPAPDWMPDAPTITQSGYYSGYNVQNTGNDYHMKVRFFGTLQLDIPEKPAPNIRGQKNTAVLAYLLYNHQRLTHRDLLMDKFWRDNAPSSAKNSLNVAICSLRKSLSKSFPRQEFIVFEQQSYGVNPELRIITDTERFLYHWKEGNQVENALGMPHALQHYQVALNYYRQEFLSNLRTENWCESERENLKEIFLYILNKLGIHYFEQHEYDKCIHTGKRMLAEDICLEEVHRRLMKCYYLQGQSDLAQMQYFKCKRALSEEMNLQPSEPTQSLFKNIQNGQSAMVASLKG